MDIEALLSRIVMDPAIMNGYPAIRNLDISVEDILVYLARILDIHKLHLNFPDLDNKDIQAALLFAAGLVKDERVFPIDHN